LALLASRTFKGVDPNTVPTRALYTGDRVPAVGLGTFGSDRFSCEQIADAVVGAASVGYRHFDCASVYGNEHLIGKSLSKIQRDGVPRNELWITSKVWNDSHDAVLESCGRSLKDLQLDYLDLYLIHWPFPNFHPPACDVSSRSADAKPYIHERFMTTWRQMEKLVRWGLVRNIGTSNMTIPKLNLLLRDAEIKPAANEMELHPHFQQPALFNYVRDNSILPIGYSPIGSPRRLQRDTRPTDTVDIEDPVIVEIADHHGIHPAAVCVKWAIQRGQVPIPFSVNPSHYLANLRAAVSPPLSHQEMRQIAAIDKNCRLIKGDAFRWRSNQTWHDLWDENGEITPA
jgi:diketogulonate reductase-like aldo/keto reductase